VDPGGLGLLAVGHGLAVVAQAARKAQTDAFGLQLASRKNQRSAPGSVPQALCPDCFARAATAAAGHDGSGRRAAELQARTLSSSAESASRYRQGNVLKGYALTG
jgi:hypothetical protein